MRRNVSPLILITGVILGFFVLLVGFVTVVGHVVPEQKFSRIDELQRVPLPDGTELVLHSVSFGASPHSIEIRRAVRGATAYGGHIDVDTLDAYVHGNRFVVWMSCQEAETGRFVNPDWWLRSSVEDENGVLHEDNNAHREIKTLTGSSSSGSSRPFKDDDNGSFSLASDPERLLVVYSTFPAVRGTGMLKLHVYNTEDKEVAVFDFPNPTPAPTVEWTPESLPCTKTSDKLQLTLKNAICREEESRYHHNNEVTIKQRQRLHTEFELLENGEKAKNWHISANEVTDVLGNSTNPYDIELSFFEPAWKLNVQVYRQQDADFPEDCIHSLGMIPLPQAGQTEGIGRSLSLPAGDVNIVYAGGSGTTRFRLPGSAHSGNHSHHGGNSVRLPGENGKTKYVNTQFNTRNGHTDVEIDSAPLPFVFLQLAGSPGNQVMYARVKDESDRDVPAQVTHSTSDGRFIWLAPESDAKQVLIDLIVDEQRQFEFSIKPPEKGQGQN